MSRSTISTFELFEKFPDVESARKYLEGRLSENGASCPRSKARENVTRRKDGFYRCNPYKLVLRVSSKDDFIERIVGGDSDFREIIHLTRFPFEHRGRQSGPRVSDYNRTAGIV